MHKEHGLSQRQACAALGLSRSVYRYEPKPRDDSPIIEGLLGWPTGILVMVLASCLRGCAGRVFTGTINVSTGYIVF